MLGRYLSNLRVDHWKIAKQVLQYLQKTKDYILTYWRSYQLQIVRCTDPDFAGCEDSMKFTLYLSTSGAAVSWKNAKQSLITSFLITIEFIAFYGAANHGI